MSFVCFVRTSKRVSVPVYVPAMIVFGSPGLAAM